MKLNIFWKWMAKKKNIEIFIDEIYSKPTKKNYPTNTIVDNNPDEIWSTGLADSSDYKTSNNKGFRCIFVIIDNFSNFLWAIPPKIKNSQTITQEFSKFLSTSKRKPSKIEFDRRKEWYNSTFQNFLRNKNIHHYSRFKHKGPSIAQCGIRTIRNLLKKPVFEKGNGSWLSEWPSVIKQYNNTIHGSIKLTPIQASKKPNEKEVSTNLKDNRAKQTTKFNLGQFVSTADIKIVFSKVDSTNWSNIL